MDADAKRNQQGSEVVAAVELDVGGLELSCAGAAGGPECDGIGAAAHRQFRRTDGEPNTEAACRGRTYLKNVIASQARDRDVAEVFGAVAQIIWVVSACVGSADRRDDDVSHSERKRTPQQTPRSARGSRTIHVTARGYQYLRRALFGFQYCSNMSCAGDGGNWRKTLGYQG